MTASKEGGNWLRALAYLLATGGLIGATTTLIKMGGAAEVPPPAFIVWSVGGAALLLLALDALRGQLPTVDRRTIEYFIVAGLFTVTLPNLIIFPAIPAIGAGFVALILASPPLFTYLGALSFGMEDFRVSRLTGVLLALGGAVLLAAYKLGDPGGSLFWIIATLTVPLILTVGNLYRTARWPDDESPASLAPGMLVAATGFTVLAALVARAFTDDPAFTDLLPDTTNTEGLAIIAGQAVVYTLQYLCFFRLQEAGGPTYLSLIGAVGAFVAVPIAVLLLGEDWPRGIVIGGLLTVVGIGLMTYGAAQED